MIKITVYATKPFKSLGFLFKDSIGLLDKRLLTSINTTVSVSSYQDKSIRNKIKNLQRYKKLLKIGLAIIWLKCQIRM